MRKFLIVIQICIILKISIWRYGIRYKKLKRKGLLY